MSQLISLETAIVLKQAGLHWEPALLDYFAIPERGLDDHRFVLSDILVTVQSLQDYQVMSFQGAPEWALDYLLLSEVVWLPREDQLRSLLEAALLARGEESMVLISGHGGCVCEVGSGDAKKTYPGQSGSEAYAAALMALMEHG